MQYAYFLTQHQAVKRGGVAPGRHGPYVPLGGIKAQELREHAASHHSGSIRVPSQTNFHLWVNLQAECGTSHGPVLKKTGVLRSLSGLP
jgi:hypothetical protein